MPGTILSFLHGAVTARTTRFAFGMGICVRYDYHNPEHRERCVIDRADGRFVSGGWDQIVAMVSRFSNWI